MDQDCFRPADAQFAKITPHLTTDTRGKAWVDERRVISCIIQVLMSGGRWVDAPSVYGPGKTLSNRLATNVPAAAAPPPLSAPDRKSAGRDTHSLRSPRNAAMIANEIPSLREARHGFDLQRQQCDWL